MRKTVLPLFVFSFSCLVSVTAEAQVQQNWVARYNGPGNGYDEGTSLKVDGSGNVYVTGSSEGSGTGDDYATVKYNSAGVEQWVQRYNGPANGSDGAYALAVDASGNVYVTGWSTGSGTGYDYATIKYNSAGVEQWVQRYNGPANGSDGAYALAVDASGNVYVTGRSDGTGGAGFDYVTIKYDSSGVEQWVQRYNAPGNGSDIAYSLVVDGSGNVHVTGSSSVIATGDDYATVKYNSAGVEQWVQRYNGPANGSDDAYALAVDASGNVYVTGWSTGSGTGYDYATIKYNSAGVEQWVQRYNGPGNGSDGAYALAVDASGNVYVTGQSTGSGTGGDYATIKYNSAGVEQWVQRYNGPANGIDYAYALAVDTSGNVYVTGWSTGSGTGNDYATIKYNSAGVEQWVQRYNGTGNGDDRALSLTVNGSGNVYITGVSFGSGTEVDYATIKYSQSLGITPISSKIPDAFRLEQNYPNPFNPTTSIKFDVMKSCMVRIVIYDILGREMERIVDGELNAGRYSVEWNASGYSSGKYFYRMTAGDFSTTRKMILVR